MSNYLLPQVSVFQDIAGTPTDSIQPLRPVLVGGNAVPVRFGVASEKEKGRLGYYDQAVDVAYPWPSRPAGGVVDAASARLFAQDALLEYFLASVDVGLPVTKVAGYPNRVRGGTLCFSANNGGTRSAGLPDRDVTPGDVALVRGTASGQPFSLWTYVRGLAADSAPSSVGAAAADAGNAGSQSASATAAFVAGPVNTVTAAASGASYNGLASGLVSETYTLVVLQGSVDGDFTTARLRVLSASGTDDVASVAPSAAGVPTAVGTRGLTVTFSLSHDGAASATAESEGVSPNDFVVGQQWRVAVAQAFTATVATSGGSYSGAADAVYAVTVVRGGAYAASPQVKVTTVTGSDASGPTAVTAAATPVAVGTKGVTVSFNGTALRAGDKFYVAAVAAAPGAERTLVLGNNLPPGTADGSNVSVTLYARRTVEVPADRAGFAPLSNWNTSATALTARAGAVVYQPDFTKDGVPVALPLVSEASREYGVLYAEYRAWVPDLAGAVQTYSADTPTDSIPGPSEAVNPLKFALQFAQANSGRSDATPGSIPVLLLAVADPSDVDSWREALDKLAGVEGAYGLVPLTKDPAVIDLFVAHAQALSAPDQGLWRRVWVSLPGFPEIPVVSAGSAVPGHLAATTSDGRPCLCVIEDDANTAGTQYTVLRCTSGNARFLTNGVTPGRDVARTAYADDGFGNVSYASYAVDAVISEDQLRLVSGPTAPQSVAVKTEVWRSLDATGEAAEVARYAGAYGSERVLAVWPDVLEAGGAVVEGYYACAALAALTGVVLPQQGVTRMTVLGFDAVPRTGVRFNRDQLNVMAKGGAFVLAQDPSTGSIFVRHAVTTAGYDAVATREEMRARNRDSVSYRFKSHYAPYIGVTNAVPSLLDQLRLDFKILRDALVNDYSTPLLGGQLTDMTLVRLSQDLTDPTAVVLVAQCVEPNPLNSFLVHQVIS